MRVVRVARAAPPLPGALPEDVDHQQNHHKEVEDEPEGEDVVPLGGGHHLGTRDEVMRRGEQVMR